MMPNTEFAEDFLACAQHVAFQTLVGLREGLTALS